MLLEEFLLGPRLDVEAEGFYNGDYLSTVLYIVHRYLPPPPPASQHQFKGSGSSWGSSLFRLPFAFFP